MTSPRSPFHNREYEVPEEEQCGEEDFDCGQSCECHCCDENENMDHCDAGEFTDSCDEDDKKEDTDTCDEEEKEGKKFVVDLSKKRRPVILGNRICDVTHLTDCFALSYESHKEEGSDCKATSWKLYHHFDKALSCFVTYKCTECGVQSSFWTSPDPNLTMMSVAGSITDGLPYENNKAAFSAVNVPYFCHKTYVRKRGKLHDIIEALAKRSMSEAAGQEKQLATDCGDVVCGIPKTPVITDGCWGTRICGHKGRGR